MTSGLWPQPGSVYTAPPPDILGVHDGTFHTHFDWRQKCPKVGSGPRLVSMLGFCGVLRFLRLSFFEV